MKVKLPGFNRFILLCLIMVSAQMVSVAQTIKGSITDAKSGETLIGATVHIEKDNFKQNTGVKLDGTYLFKNIPAGTYTLQASYVGYKTSKQYTVEVKSANSEAILNIALTNDANTLGEVAVTGHMNKASEGAARSVEKNAGVTLNAVSAQAIALSPDVLVSNVLSRVSGISISRGNTGDARHVIIRGMDKQYNTTLINGIKIPSPDNKNRYVPLDIFPAELVDRLDVYKTLTPDMEADASGGVVNLVMKTAPDKLKIEGNFGTGYSKIFMDRKYESFDRSTVNSKSPGELAPGTAAAISQFPYQNLLTNKKVAPPNMNASLTIGDRFLNNKLGVLFSGSYQNSYQGNNSFVVVQENTVGPSPDINTPNQETAFQSSYKRQYSANVKRIGTMAALDYKINNANTLKFFATYLQLDEYSVRQTESSSYGGYSYQGYRGTYSIDNFTQTRSDLQSIYNFTLSGKHFISKKFSIDWTGASSQASHKLPDIAEFHTDYGTNPSATTNQPTGNPSEPYTSVASAIDKSPVQVANESRQWQRNTDKDLSGYFNLHYNSDNIFGRRAEFSAGGMYRHKTRDNYSNAYSLPNTYIAGTGNPELYTSIPEATFSFAPYPDNAYGSYRSSAGVYSFKENVQGGYGMVKYALSKKLDAIFGLRVEKTDQNYYSNLPVTFPGKTGAISYSDYLPSINIKYAIDDEQAIRASYFKSILRPAFADLIPYPDGTTDDPYQHTGNPYLQHTVIDNYDLRYEFFPGVFDEFMVGAYFKNLDNPIETVLLPGGSGATLYLQPQNLGRARNYGAELVAKKFWGDIGASINYTYTQSRITTLKSINVNGNVTSRLQTRPLQGQAAHIGNASILYKNQKYGIDAQLSLSYNGERIQAVSNYYGLDTWERPSTYLDFSAQKKIGKHFIIYVKANDLLNTPYQLIIKQDNKYNYSGILKYANQKSPNYTTVQYDQFYARYSLGAKYNF